MALRLALLFSLLVATAPALGQQEPTFQPPIRPPPPDMLEFEEPDENSEEVGEDGFRPPPPPPPPPSVGFNPQQPSPTQTSRPDVGGGNFTSGPTKLKFKVVEGEFFEKGAKRPRGQKIRAE